MKSPSPRLLLVQVNWHDRYDGSTVGSEGDFETCNFVPFEDHYYGAIPRKVKIDLGAGTTDDLVNDITVVWVASRKIVGWYEGATVFRERQIPHPSPKALDYAATCRVENGKQLSVRERTFDVIAEGGCLGRARHAFPDPAKDRAFIAKVHGFIRKHSAHTIGPG